MHPKVFLSLCVGVVCYLHFKKCGKHKKFNHKFQQFCLQPALDKLPFSFPSIKCRNTMRIRFFLHFQSSRHSSMVSKVACYWVGPRFKSRQGMIYPKISMMNGTVADEVKSACPMYSDLRSIKQFIVCNYCLKYRP